MKSFLTFLLLLAFFIPVAVGAETAQNMTHVNLTVDGCNFDGYCNSATETDQNCPSDCTSGSTTTGGSYSPNTIHTVHIIADTRQATVTWQSSLPTFSTLRWGTTPDATDGASHNVVLTVDHHSVIAGLTPDTIYYFSLENTDVSGRVAIYTSSFKTLALPDTVAPQNPSHFTGTVTSSGIALVWATPPDRDFAYVRIMRNTTHFETDPFLGTLVYEGSDTSVIDTVVTPGTTYFYTIFSRDWTGNFSSGAAVAVDFEVPQGQNTAQTVPIVSAMPAPHIAIIQHGNELPTVGNTVLIDGSQEISIVISGSDRGDVSVVITTPDGEHYTYLATADTTAGVYQISIPALALKGDYQLQIRARANGVLTELGSTTLRVLNTAVPPKDYVTFSFFNFLVLLISIIMFWLFARFRKEFFFEE